MNRQAQYEQYMGMEAPQGQVEAIKLAIISGKSDATTVTALRELLGLNTARTPSNAIPAARAKAGSRNGVVQRNGRSTIASSRTATIKPTSAKAAAVLSAKQRYAFATETANACLKCLTDSLKARKENLSNQSPRSKRPLQPRSGNSTPMRSPPKRPSENGKPGATSPESSGSPSEGYVRITAKCARSAFGYLRRVDYKAIGVREPPRFQLESGILALVGKLIGHKLNDLAAKELFVVKECLRRASRGAFIQHEEAKQKLADLLSLNLPASAELEDEALPVVVNYYQHVLKLISARISVGERQRIPDIISVDDPNGLVQAINRHGEVTGDTAKTRRNLESIAHTLLGFCPGVATSTDEAALDVQRWPRPEAVLKLQILALRVRGLACQVADQQIDVTKEIVEPFSKCFAAFARRFHGDPTAASEVLERSYSDLEPLLAKADRTSLLLIQDLLCTKASVAGRWERARKWSDEMLQNCTDLDANHARRIAASVKQSSVDAAGNSDYDGASLRSIKEALSDRITGSRADYDSLIASLTSLFRAFHAQKNVSADHGETVTLAAGFAQRYARSYLGRNTSDAQYVIEAALRLSKSTEDVLSWITTDAATVYYHSGVLKEVVDRAATRPLNDAFAVSGAAASLGRISKALTLRAIKGDGEALQLEDHSLSALEHGTVLEWQLRYLLELAPRSKYHDALEKTVPDILRRLSKSYSVADYPVRRARVASMVYTFRECHAACVPPHVLKPWSEDMLLNDSDLGSDAGLAAYVADIKTRLSIGRMFVNGTPAVEDVKPNLDWWEQVLSRCSTDRSVSDSIDDAEILARQLSSIATYCSMLGADSVALLALQLLSALHDACGDAAEAIATALEQARLHLRLGSSGQARSFLEQAQKQIKSSGGLCLAELQHQVTLAEYCHAIDDRPGCLGALAETRRLRQTVQPQHVPREQRRMYELLHARAWLVHSEYCLKAGSPHESLAAGKHAVRILNSIWAALEKAEGRASPKPEPDPSEGEQSAVSGLAKGVSKLNLTPEAPPSQQEQRKRGAAFWPLVPILCPALMHLSDVYAHHGTFDEANYYSQRAVGVAESIGSRRLLYGINTHGSRLLTFAGRLEEVQLCLAQDDDVPEDISVLAKVERLAARAAVHVKEGALETAVKLYGEAEILLQGALAGKSPYLRDEKSLVSDMQSLSIEHNTAQASKGRSRATSTARKTSSKSRGPVKKPTSTQARRPQVDTAAAGNGNAIADSCYPITKLMRQISLERDLVLLQLGKTVDNGTIGWCAEASSANESFLAATVEHERLLRHAIHELEADVSLNVLTESTLALPSVDGQNPRPLPRTDAARVKADSRRTKPGRAGTLARSVDLVPSETTEERAAAFLSNAMKFVNDRELLLLLQGSTAQTHAWYSKLFNAALLRSAISVTTPEHPVQPVEQAKNVELPRIKALQYGRSAVDMDNTKSNDSDPMAWPPKPGSRQAALADLDNFQANYIDILPKSWTAVSLCLNEDCSELYIARYRCSQPPLVLKLPFARHKPEGADDETFDFHGGKAELQEIIELSNYTCHNPGDLKAKGTKTKWWSEREALDRRLHELLINIENIWFGGFKSVLSQKPTNREKLAQFRKDFEQVLARYLPSRQTTKDRGRQVVLDEQILQLFIGLGCDDTVEDLEEPLTDLLYFAIDMLQFGGERNAYDEIDFDSMAVDVLDALRSYHDANSDEYSVPQHLVLVLDRRLQAFPWENLPCLQEASVSRVGSMLSLRRCLLAQQAQRWTDESYGQHVVSKRSGTYILNPSSDLSATQTTLQPVLSKLSEANKAWAAMVNAAPTEEQFSSALQNAPMFLYFGHGGGSQYIRSRTVKRLQTCSEVVWLMGCSSGAVQEHGDLEPCAIPLDYLGAGSDDLQAEYSRCKAVVATLWDVTDKDIDRFSLALGEEWGLWPSSEQTKMPAKTPRKRQILAAPSTPEQVPKTPKTPKAWKTPAAAKTPARARSQSRPDAGRKLSLVEAVTRSREACYLRYLNGAAPVVYGIPVYLGD